MVIIPGHAAIARAIAAAVAVGFAVLAVGCDSTPPAELQARFDDAERLYLDQRYDEAQAQLKAYLLLDPLHPGAHFYLGMTYLAPMDIRTSVLAENEFQLALKLFESQNRQCGIKRYDARYFELMCHLNTAQALYVQAGVLEHDRALRGAARQLLVRAQEYIERGRAVNPKAAEVGQIERLIRGLAADLDGSSR